MAVCRQIVILVFLCVLASCSKNNDATGGNTLPPGFKLSYGDSIFYLQNQATDYVITPVASALTGTYSGFPEGIDIDTKTGAVNVSKSEMGLRYRISFLPDAGKDSVSTIILLSGINFLDGFYKLNTADSILKPVYNGNIANAVPGVNNGSVFDEGSGCNSNGCNVNTGSGSINLAQTVRNGVFGPTPVNNDRHEFQMNYRINDKSGKSLNTLKVKLYFFNSMADVTQEAYDIIASRDGTIFRSAGAGASTTDVFTGATARVFNASRAAKPRPPCIFIVVK